MNAKITSLALGLLIGIGIGYTLPNIAHKTPGITVAKNTERPKTNNEHSNLKNNVTQSIDTARTQETNTSFITSVRKSLILSRNDNEKYYKLYILLQNLTTEQIPEMLQLLQSNGDFRSDPECLKLFFKRWGELDPQGALTWSATNSGSLPKTNFEPFSISILSGWAALEPDNALAWAKENLTDRERVIALEKIISRIAETDPETALQLYESESFGSSYSGSVSAAIIPQLIEKNPEIAVARFTAMKDPNKRRQALILAAYSWAAKDPNSTLRWLEHFPDKYLRDNLFEAAISTIARTDPDIAIAYVKGIPEKHNRELLLNQLIGNLTESHCEKALALIDELPVSSERTDRHQKLLTRWIGLDYKAATDYVLNLDNAVLKQTLLPNIIPQIASNDFAEALKIAKLIKNPEEYQHALNNSVLQFAFTNNPQAALEYLDDIPEENRAGYIAHLIRYWAKRDIESALKTSLSIQDPSLKSAALNMVIINMSQHTPERALQLIKEIPASEQSIAIHNLAMSWAEKHPEAAVKWITTTLPDEQKIEVYKSLFYKWAGSDAEAASRALKNLPAGNPRDAAVTVFTQQISKTDPETAAIWANTIDNTGSRFNTLKQILPEWFRANNAAATAWSDNNLTPEQKQQLLNPKE